MHVLLLLLLLQSCPSLPLSSLRSTWGTSYTVVFRDGRFRAHYCSGFRHTSRTSSAFISATNPPGSLQHEPHQHEPSRRVQRTTQVSRTLGLSRTPHLTTQRTVNPACCATHGLPHAFVSASGQPSETHIDPTLRADLFSDYGLPITRALTFSTPTDPQPTKSTTLRFVCADLGTRSKLC